MNFRPRTTWSVNKTHRHSHRAEKRSLLTIVNLSRAETAQAIYNLLGPCASAQPTGDSWTWRQKRYSLPFHYGKCKNTAFFFYLHCVFIRRQYRVLFTKREPKRLLWQFQGVDSQVHVLIHHHIVVLVDQLPVLRIVCYAYHTNGGQSEFGHSHIRTYWTVRRLQ